MMGVCGPLPDPQGHKFILLGIQRAWVVVSPSTPSSSAVCRPPFSLSLFVLSTWFQLKGTLWGERGIGAHLRLCLTNRLPLDTLPHFSHMMLVLISLLSRRLPDDAVDDDDSNSFVLYFSGRGQFFDENGTWQGGFPALWLLDWPMALESLFRRDYSGELQQQVVAV